jgi:uncharacterized protein
MDDFQSLTDSQTEPSVPFGRRLLRGGVLFGAVPYAAITMLLAVGQRQLLYHPMPSSGLPVAECGLASTASDVTLTSTDGLTLHGWLLNAEANRRAEAAGSQVQQGVADLPLVIYFPGNASNRRGRINDLCDFTRLGCDVLIFDYRGYAENAGSPTEAGITADSRSIWQFAVEELNRDPGEILLFGESLGGAVAIDLAAWLSRQGTPPAGLITNATFDSIPDLAAAHYPVLPLRWLVWDRWGSIDRIGEVTCPLLMFHGTADTLIPLEHGRRLFAAAPDRSADGITKTFVPIANAGHNDIPVSRLRQEVRRLMSQAVTAGDSPRDSSVD